MFRLLLIAAALALILWLWRMLFHFPRLPWERERRRVRVDPERMMRCGHCGTFVPKSEAIMDGDTAFCSEEHRRRGKAADG